MMHDSKKNSADFYANANHESVKTEQKPNEQHRRQLCAKCPPSAAAKTFTPLTDNMVP